jgi:hypothetical protein
MDIRIWQLTQLGTRAARNPSNPNDPIYKIISFLDFMGSATTEQISDHVLSAFPDLNYGDVSIALHKLARMGLVEDVSRAAKEQYAQQ